MPEQDFWQIPEGRMGLGAIGRAEDQALMEGQGSEDETPDLQLDQGQTRP